MANNNPQFTYYTKDGDVLDEILQNYYGDDTAMLKNVYDANPGLADLGPVFGVNIPIVMPDAPAAVPLTPISPWTAR